MRYFLIGCALVFCCLLILWRQGVNRSRLLAARAPLSEIEHKLVFILDVCDGNQKKADALLQEKMMLDTELSYEQAVDLVFADMLELTAEERNAIARHASRKSA